MEYFDLYDSNGQKLNKIVPRGTKLQGDEYHIVVNVWIRNQKGQYLIQQRNKLSDKLPFLWDCTAGSAISGDTSLETAAKETFEELGILLNKEKLKFIKRYTIKDNYASFILDTYLIEENILLKDLRIDKSEVKDAKYASMKEIIEQLKQGKFKDYDKILKQTGYFELIEKS